MQYHGHIIYHVISLVIIFIDILLSLLIVFTYLFIPSGSLIQSTSPSSYCNFNSYSRISCLLGLNFFHLDHSIEPYNWQKPTKQNQPRMVLALGWRDSSLKCKHYILKTSVIRLRCTARQIQQNTAPWCLFDSTRREVGSTGIALGHSSLKATGERLGEKKA